MAKPTFTRVVIVGASLLLLCQLIRPARTNPAVDPGKTLAATSHASPEVLGALDRACGDCHSSRTRWPWYTNVAPISWWIIDHVNEGRRRASFSKWGNYDKSRKLKELDEICKRTERGNMPLTSYLLVHRDAALTTGEQQAICAWTKTEASLP